MFASERANDLVNDVGTKGLYMVEGVWDLILEVLPKGIVVNDRASIPCITVVFSVF